MNATATETRTERKTQSRKGTFLRYRADRRPVAFVLFGFAAHLAAFLAASFPLGLPLSLPLDVASAAAAESGLSTGFWIAPASLVPLTVLSLFVAPINHHHQHFNTFRSATLNRLYEIFLALQTGISPYGWVLHHNLGHHRNYLNQRPHPEPDESKWTRRDGSQMGPLEYTIDLVLHNQIDMWKVGRKHPRFLRAFVLMKIPVWGFILILLYLNPAVALLTFVIPGFVTLCHTAYSTYAHHAGLYPTTHYDASMNNTSRIYNFMTCNLGYHTAHHKRPGVHWSLLPKLHEDIQREIPPELIRTTFWSGNEPKDSPFLTAKRLRSSGSYSA